MYKLSYEEVNEARRHLEKAEDIFRKQSLHIAKIINDAHFTAINFLEVDNLSKPKPNPKKKHYNIGLRSPKKVGR